MLALFIQSFQYKPIQLMTHSLRQAKTSRDMTISGCIVSYRMTGCLPSSECDVVLRGTAARYPMCRPHVVARAHIL